MSSSTNATLHQQADSLAVNVEQTIKHSRGFLESCPDFEQRKTDAERFREAFGK